MKKYSEELQDPRWQKKRLEILSRDNFTCRLCGSSLYDGKPLNIHHIAYRPNTKPWDYPDEMLVTLCEDCHKKVHKKQGGISKADVEPFFLTYNKAVEALFDKGVFNASTKVFMKLMSFADYNTGKVHMSTERIEEILKSCSISRASYQRAINDLIKEKVITKGKGSYTIAENMFWKGDLKMREKIIKAKMNLTFSPVLPDA